MSMAQYSVDTSGGQPSDTIHDQKLPALGRDLMLDQAAYSEMFDPRLSRADVERVRLPNGDLKYGALPFFSDRPANLEKVLTEDHRYLRERLGQTDRQLDPHLMLRKNQALLLHRLKFGGSLTAVMDGVLAHYPLRAVGAWGRCVHIFGLSGSGKSLAAKALKEHFQTEAIIVDSDATRYGLFASRLRGTEGSHNSRNDGLIHSPGMSMILYTALEYICDELSYRGYLVIRLGTAVDENAKELYYIEHKSGIDPLRFCHPNDIGHPAKRFAMRRKIDSAVERLFCASEQRESRPFDWDSAREITRFEDMEPVTVTVPAHIHRHTLLRIGRILRTIPPGGSIRRIPNPACGSESEAKENLLRHLLRAGISRTEHICP